jgi:hypothetical protein
LKRNYTWGYANKKRLNTAGLDRPGAGTAYSTSPFILSSLLLFLTDALSYCYHLPLNGSNPNTFLCKDNKPVSRMDIYVSFRHFINCDVILGNMIYFKLKGMMIEFITFWQVGAFQLF